MDGESLKLILGPLGALVVVLVVAYNRHKKVEELEKKLEEKQEKAEDIRVKALADRMKLIVTYSRAIEGYEVAVTDLLDAINVVIIGTGKSNEDITTVKEDLGEILRHVERIAEDLGT